ncbi:branched-chain amino acid ABC transporter permease [Pseudonocardiaceae bacterium YIM PH 21723]|nr:branched-chain amino acid ABC transporter permease [Pseudonocardiaceae bacterium YIM PH 21723]
MAAYLEQLVNGLVLGSIIGLIALGYTMVYGVIQLINFAHGEVFMVGAYASLACYLWILPPDLAGTWYIALPAMILFGSLVAALLAIAMERFAYRPLRGAPRLAPLITALGVSVFLQEVVRLFFPDAKQAKPYPTPFIEGGITVHLGDGQFTIAYIRILLVVVAIGLAALLQLYISRSRMGRAMRAIANDPDTARLMGINPDRIIVWTFVIGAVLAGVAGVFYGGYQNTINTDMGFQNGIFAFTAAVLGGIGSIRGAVVGAMIIGVVKTIAGQLPFLGGTQYDYVWIFVVLIFMLVFRPQGFFGETERVRA